MATLALTTEQIALVVVAVIGVVAIATWAINRQRRDVWESLAKRRRLHFVDSDDGPRITGQVAGRPVEVVIDDGGSDRDVGGVEVVRMTVTLRGVAREMTAEGIPGLIGDLAGYAEKRIHFQQEDFDRHVLVKAADEAATRSYWNRRRQQFFLELIQSAPCDQVFLDEGCLSAELREIVSDRDQLEQLMDQLLAAAPVLDDETQGKE